MASPTTPGMYKTASGYGDEIAAGLVQIAADFQQGVIASPIRTFAGLQMNMNAAPNDEVKIERVKKLTTASGASTRQVSAGAAIPFDGRMPQALGTITIKQFGQGAKYEVTLDQIKAGKLNTQTMNALMQDAIDALDLEAYTALATANCKYVGTAADAATLTFNGTASGTNASPLNSYHVKRALRTLRQMGCKPIPGIGRGGTAAYGCILSEECYSEITDDTDWKNQNTYRADSTGIITGEVGELHNCVFARDTNQLSDSPGTGGTSGEAFFFGVEYLQQALSLAPEIRSDILAASTPGYQGEGNNAGLWHTLTWVAILGYGTVWNVAGTTTADSYINCVHWTNS